MNDRKRSGEELNRSNAKKVSRAENYINFLNKIGFEPLRWSAPDGRKTEYYSQYLTKIEAVKYCNILNKKFEKAPFSVITRSFKNDGYRFQIIASLNQGHLSENIEINPIIDAIEKTNKKFKALSLNIRAFKLYFPKPLICFGIADTEKFVSLFGPVDYSILEAAICQQYILYSLITALKKPLQLTVNNFDRTIFNDKVTLRDVEPPSVVLNNLTPHCWGSSNPNYANLMKIEPKFFDTFYQALKQEEAELKCAMVCGATDFLFNKKNYKDTNVESLLPIDLPRDVRRHIGSMLFFSSCRNTNNQIVSDLPLVSKAVRDAAYASLNEAKASIERKNK